MAGAEQSLTFVVASGGGGDGEGTGRGVPRLVAAFTFVLLGPVLFGLARDAFGFVATAETEKTLTEKRKRCKIGIDKM
jgi:hypothetical protein